MHTSKFNFNFVISSPENIDIDYTAINESNANGGSVVVIHDPYEACS